MPEPGSKILNETLSFEKRLWKEENAIRSLYVKLLQSFREDGKKRGSLKGISSRHFSTAKSLEEQIRRQGELPQGKKLGDALENEDSFKSPEVLLKELRTVEKNQYSEYDEAIHHLSLSATDKEFLYKRVLKRKRQNLLNLNDLLPPENAAPFHLPDLVRYLSRFIEGKKAVDTSIAFNNGAAKVVAIALEAGRHLNEHKIPSQAMLLVLEGQIVLEIQGSAHNLGPLDAFDILKNAVRSIRSVKDSKFLLIH